MADRKISDLTALTTPASGDYLPIVDISETAAASKNKRITIEELFRGVPLGTAAAPSIAIEGDENTGIYSPGADQLAISTNGTGRLFVASDGRVMHNHSGAVAANPFSSSHVPRLVTTSTETTNYQGLGSIAYNGSSAGLWLGKSAGTTVNTVNALTGGVHIGAITFAGADGAGFINAARILCVVDGAVSTGVVPGALLFATSVSGPAPTERARIDSSGGRLLLGTSSDSGGALLQVNDNRIRIATAKTPSSASDTGTAGEICWDANYIYVCTATNTWKRTAISTW